MVDPPGWTAANDAQEAQDAHPTSQSEVEQSSAETTFRILQAHDRFRGNA